ncbi:MAG: 50S ribosomal protein L10 [Candidatus Aminicenantes bacterium]|nr:50S ribosomal protein L10 [Candidatus Aminicenantes bacterium]
MNVNVERKEKLVNEIHEFMSKNDSFYLLDFMKMPVSLAVEFRKQMRENSYSFLVVKNRLALRALKDDFPEDLKLQFRGPTAIAFAQENPIGLARLIKDFSVRYKILSVKGGIVEGQLLEEKRFADIAKLTSKNDLLAKLGYLMAYPLMTFLRTWQAPLNSVGSMLDQLKSKK